MRVFSNISDKSSKSPVAPQKWTDTNQLCANKFLLREARMSVEAWWWIKVGLEPNSDEPEEKCKTILQDP